MIELAYILLMTAGGFFWALGGFGTTPPQWWQGKYWRRFVLPAVTIGLLYWLSHYINFDDWKIWGCGLTLCFAAHLGYGENSSDWQRVLTACSYPLPALWFGWTWWLFITPVGFLILFGLSNWSATSKDFTWKVCEFMIGTIIQITIIGSLQRMW